MKYINYEVTFSEIPDEITLCINITNCPLKCPGCHSPYLAEDIGEELTLERLYKIIRLNKGVSCICFMGGDLNPYDVEYLAFMLRMDCNYKLAWYSGKIDLPKDFKIDLFDYIKLGPYVKELGGLNNPNTNQRMFKITENKMFDITHIFWKNVSKNITR
jgi:anaerobic ribonucleoside-triphosphate reductase activating protein